MTTASPKNAVLFLATGSASSPEDVEEFLLDIRDGRAPSPELLAEVKERYRLIGGSPFLRITLAQADALKQELARRGLDLPVFAGMCHCAPRIHDAVAKMQSAGIRKAVAIVMAPLHASFNQARYSKRLRDAQRSLGTDIEVRWIESWWEEPKFIEVWTTNIRKALAPDSAKTRLLFTAHSLPERILRSGDRYDKRFRACAAAVADRLGYADWDTAFQSAGASPEPWLGPSLKDRLPGLAEAGYGRVLVAPIGFVCDNAEILYDIEAKALARENGLRLDRAELPNTMPLFIEAVADAVVL
jgi:ferrochelatase